MTEEYPDDVEAWIELAGILEQSDVQVHQPYLHVIDLAGVGSTQQSFIQGGLTQRPNLFPFFIVIIMIIIIIISNGNRTERSPVQSAIIRVINKIGRQRSGSLICFITSMITERIGRHEVLLSINHN